MRALLDVSVLIALLDARHVHHRTARHWMEQNVHSGWASCPITENGFVRIVTQPRYPNPTSIREASARLAEARATQWHAFWPDSVSLLTADTVDWTYVHGPLQLTDVYLLALATANHGCLVTFDQRINRRAVPEASPDNLVQL